MGQACSASLNRPVRTRTLWWCGEGHRRASNKSAKLFGRLCSNFLGKKGEIDSIDDADLV